MKTRKHLMIIERLLTDVKNVLENLNKNEGDFSQVSESLRKGLAKNILNGLTSDGAIREQVIEKVKKIILSDAFNILDKSNFDIVKNAINDETNKKVFDSLKDEQAKTLLTQLMKEDELYLIVANSVLKSLKNTLITIDGSAFNRYNDLDRVWASRARVERIADLLTELNGILPETAEAGVASAKLGLLNEVEAKVKSKLNIEETSDDKELEAKKSMVGNFNTLENSLRKVEESHTGLKNYINDPSKPQAKHRAIRIVGGALAAAIAIGAGGVIFDLTRRNDELNQENSDIKTSYAIVSDDLENSKQQLEDALQNMVAPEVYEELQAKYNEIIELIPAGQDVEAYIIDLQNSSDMYNVLMSLIPAGQDANEYIQNLQADSENYNEIIELLPEGVNANEYVVTLLNDKNNYDAIMALIPENQDAIKYVEALIEDKGDLAEIKLAYDAIMAEVPENQDAVSYIQAIVSTNGDLEKIKTAYELIMAEVPENQDAVEYIKALVESNGALAKDKEAYDAIMAVIPENQDAVSYIQALLANQDDLTEIKEAYDAIMAEVPENQDAVSYIKALVSKIAELEKDKAAYDAIMAVIPEGKDAVTYINDLVSSNGTLANDKALLDAIMAVIPEGKDAVTYINELKGAETKYNALMMIIPENVDAVTYIKELQSDSVKFAELDAYVPEGKEPVDYIIELLTLNGDLKEENGKLVIENDELKENNAELGSEIERLEGVYQKLVGDIDSLYSTVIGGSQTDPIAQINEVIDYYVENAGNEPLVHDFLVDFVAEVTGMSYEQVMNMSPSELVSMAEKIVGLPSSPSQNPDGNIRGEESTEKEENGNISSDLPPVRE